MSIQDWCDLNYSKLQEACIRISENSDLAQELLHYTLEVFLEREDCKDIVGSGGAFFYCLKIATNSWKSTTSPFFRIYRVGNEELNPVHEYPEASELPEDLELLHHKVEEAIQTLSWYEKTLLESYAHDFDANASRLAQETRIPRTSINLTLKRVRAHIKTHCHESPTK